MCVAYHRDTVTEDSRQLEICAHPQEILPMPIDLVETQMQRGEIEEPRQ